MYRAFVVPQTIVIDNDGRVLFARHGVINTRQALDSVADAALKPEPKRTVGLAAVDPMSERRLRSLRLILDGG